MGFSFKKMGKTLSQTFNPFSDDFDGDKALLALGTLGISAGVELGGEFLGETGKMIGKESGRGLGNFTQDVSEGFNLGYGNGLTGGTKQMTTAQVEATNEMYDPRRKRGGNSNFGTLTGQFDSQPSLIG